MAVRLTHWTAIIIAAAAIVPAAAQQPDIATNQEIFAAYCAGVLRTKLGNAPSESKFPETRQRWAQLARYRDYLAARGVLSNQRSPATVQGANLSAERGRLDQLACARQRDTCIDRCLAKPVDGDQASDCVDICVNSEPRCIQVSRCLEPNLQFPF